MSDLLPGRTKLKGIRRLLLSVTAQKVLADQLKAILRPGAAVGPFRLAEVHFKPGRNITAYYDTSVNTKSPKGHYVRPIAVTWGQNAHADRQENATVLATIQAEAVRHGVTAPFQQLWADFRDWNMRVWVSPLDARFTQLVRMADPQYVRAVLTWMGVGASHLARSGEYAVTSLKYRPNKRHVLRYDPLDAGAGAVFAKLYIGEDRARAFRREDAARSFRVVSKAAEWPAENGSRASCLRPFTYLAEDAALLYPRLAGTPLSDFARRSVGDAARWLRSVGAALRTLHQMPAELIGPLGPPHDFAAEIRLIAKKSDHIPTLLPRVGAATEALLDRMRELHERLPQEPPTFTHGDLKSEHIGVAPGRLTVMDFDSAHMADPALDVGYFLADWQFWNATSYQPGLEKVQESFLAGYAPGVPKERLIRARLYEAVGLINCAVRRVQLFEHEWAYRTAALVERAQTVLNDLQFFHRHTCRPAVPEGSTRP